MAKVVLIGTSHKYQTRSDRVDAAHSAQFEHLLKSLCFAHKAKGIAEEMNSAALDERNVRKTVAQVVSEALNIEHQLSDPTPEIRQQLGVDQENDIEVNGFLKNWSRGEIDAKVRRSHEIRERFWLLKINELNTWPLLFVCGANHVESFAALLCENRFEVVVEFADWAPNS